MRSGYPDILEDLVEVSNHLASIPTNLQKPSAPSSKEEDAIQRVYDYLVSHNIDSMNVAEFKRVFPQIAQKYKQLLIEIRGPGVSILTKDQLKTWLDKAQDDPGYSLGYREYEDPAHSFRATKQLVLQLNKGAKIDTVISQDPLLEKFIQLVAQGSMMSDHPVGPNTVGWLRVDFIDGEWLLVDEVQSDLINSAIQAKSMVLADTYEDFMGNMPGNFRQQYEQKLMEKGFSTHMWEAGKRQFLQAGFTIQKLDEIKDKLSEMFKNWSEYAFASILKIAKSQGIKNVAMHTAMTIASRDPFVDASKVDRYYNQLARSFGFKKEQVDHGDLRGEFWVRSV